MVKKTIFFSITLAFLVSPFLQAEEVTSADDRKSVSLTVYNSNLAMVRDNRKISLVEGEQQLAFEGISSQILPETAMLKGEGVEVIEQSYEYDLLSPASLLQKYVGKQVTLARKSGREEKEVLIPALVLSTANGGIFQVEGKIETEVGGRIIYPNVPDNLRDKPTLLMALDSEVKGEKDMELSYLTGGLHWKADYVAELNASEDRINVKGWVTLTNNTGTSFEDAGLQLVAGEVNRAQESVMMAAQEKGVAVQSFSRKSAPVQRESLAEYHLYTVGKRTTLKDNQSKQIGLLQENDGICAKELILSGSNQAYYYTKLGEISKRKGVDVFLQIKNDKASNLGSPKPAGIMRVYKKDSNGLTQFIGEDRIDHTPENETIRLRLGKSFDVTADRVQKDFVIIQQPQRTPNSANKRSIFESEYEITLRNGKEKAAVVFVEESLPGDWDILSSSEDYAQKDAKTVRWKLKVEAGGTTTLKYRARVAL